MFARRRRHTRCGYFQSQRFTESIGDPRRVADQILVSNGEHVRSPGVGDHLFPVGQYAVGQVEGVIVLLMLCRLAEARGRTPATIERYR